MEFSHSSGFGSPLLAEILAIEYAVEYLDSTWGSRSRLIVESDSKNVVEWIISPALSEPLFYNLIQGMSSWPTLVNSPYPKVPKYSSGSSGKQRNRAIGCVSPLGNGR
ncbi:hypothetical protein V6N13_075748 [Hibiscus sabdariffa]|uniref:RNase H type-1 domain-containing protein n=1 Tax=Hibiscus sabdariffa TaxID=183260 RepID=A0ABR2UCJ4_9ROSI